MRIPRLPRFAGSIRPCTLVVDQRFTPIWSKDSTTTPDSGAFIRLTDYQPNHPEVRKLRLDRATGGIFGIYYDKGWNATIDGKYG